MDLDVEILKSALYKTHIYFSAVAEAAERGAKVDVAGRQYVENSRVLDDLCQDASRAVAAVAMRYGWINRSM